MSKKIDVPKNNSSKINAGEIGNTESSSIYDLNELNTSYYLKKSRYWQKLHSAIIDFRIRNNLNISDFLESCGLSPYRTYFKQLCSSLGKDMNPSMKPGSPGHKFQEIVARNLMQENEIMMLGFDAEENVNEDSAPDNCDDFEVLLGDWVLDNYEFLQENDIYCISGKKQGVVELHAKSITEPSDADIIYKLNCDPKINMKFAQSNMKIVRYKSTLALSLPVITQGLSHPISIDELHLEKCFLFGYKATKNGKLLFVALFNGKPSWFGTRVVNNIAIDKATILELTVVDQERKSLSPSLSHCRYKELEYRRIVLLQDEDLRDRLRTAAFIISRNVLSLFRTHSNLVAVEPCWIDGKVVIQFLVICKHYIPEGEVELPEFLVGFRTQVRQGWFRLTCYCGGLKPQSSLKPGCALSAEQTSGRNGVESTFGTVGGYVTMKGASYAVTVGHLFPLNASSSNVDTFPVGSTVVANPHLAQIMHHYIDEGFGDQRQIRVLSHTHGKDVYKRMEKTCKLNSKDMDDIIVSCGILVGCQFGQSNSFGKVVDVAVISVDGPAVPFDGNGLRAYKTEEINLPTLVIDLDGDWLQESIVQLDDAIGCKAHGYGAFTSADIKVTIQDTYTVFVVDRTNLQSPIFQCCRGTTVVGGFTMQPGDSGTWFWSDEKKLLGMGIGTEGGDVLILPMKDVVDTVVDILQPNHTDELPELSRNIS